MAKRNIVVIGASAGGLTILQRLVAALPGNLPATLFVVQHVAPEGPGLLAGILDRAGNLRVVTAQDGQRHEASHLYVAPPDYHMLLKEPGIIAVSHGPRENRHRPSIDALFRSAARTYGARTVAILLTGMLDDGVMGLALVKSQGGVVIVQDPAEAEYPDLPRNAINNVAGIDYVVPVASIAALLLEFVQQEVEMDMSPADEGAFYPEGDELEPEDSQETILAGDASGFVCPECGGALWEVRQGQTLGYHCHVGHRYGPQTLLAEQSEAIESALWASLRTLEEQAALARSLADHYRQYPHLGKHRNDHLEQAEALEAHARTVRDLVLKPLHSTA